MAYPDIDLEGAIVVVTGGARGIGQSTADLFRARRATVCVGDLDSAQSSAAAGVRIVAVDVTSRDSFAEFVTTVIERHRRIDVLVNNAGVMPLGDFLSEDDAISRTIST
jgi:NAD(P)-dependent dehydrogenase (short-subunit alcohol dehydrogenase family)